jgi:23S rRNA (pseudouridine1915-N3)-methyltransferase
MKITLLMVGKTSEAYLTEGINQYVKRIQRYVKFELKIIKDIKASKYLPVKNRKSQEGQAILNLLGKDDYLVLLDERGKEISSVKFAKYIDNKMITNTSSLVFLIGGAYGFSEAVYNRAKERISLSKMTYSHQLIRLIFAEQLYRAFSIINGEPYHNE